MDYVFNGYKKAILTGAVNIIDDTINVILLSDHTIDLNNTYYNDISEYEIDSGNGYTTGGKTLENKIVSINNVDNRGAFDCDDVIWSASTITARYAAVYKNTGDSSTSLLLFYIDFGENKTTSTGNFTLRWDTNGVFFHNGVTGE